MGIANLVRSKGYKNFMAKLYGIGASVVIIGALFKINHYWGANGFLIVGLATEAIIFFFSAFEPPHIDPDWSLVYPQLAGLDKPGRSKNVDSASVTQQLDDMLSNAKIGPELIQSLGDGLRKMSENTSKMSEVTNAAVANDEFVKNVKAASKSVNELSSSYMRTAESLDQNTNVAKEFSTNLRSASGSVTNLAGVYNEVSTSIRKEMDSTEQLSGSIRTATESANKLALNYNKSAEILTKSAEMLNFSAVDGKTYNEQLQKISSNLAALNTVYELQLKGSKEQIESTSKMRTTVDQFMNNLNDSSTNMTKYKEEIDSLTKRVAALNNVYGNMLTAMNVNLK
jgi:gliding motility-associated protein GldL